MKVKLKTTAWDSAEFLRTSEEIEAYLEACAEDGDPALMAHALGVVARASNMSKVARDSGMTRMGLYKALSKAGNPTFATVSSVAKALGYRVAFLPAKPAPKSQPRKPAGVGKRARTAEPV